MAQQEKGPIVTGTIVRNQVLFVRYFNAVLVDLVVLGLLNEYWNRVDIDSFSVALLAAVILQVLLKVSLALEHKVGMYFKKKSGLTAKVMRIVSAWGILFVSKLIILWAIDVAFGNSFIFHGKFHGVFPFLILIVVIIMAEKLVQKIFFALGPVEKN
jgi:hypothetical protein